MCFRGYAGDGCSKVANDTCVSLNGNQYAGKKDEKKKADVEQIITGHL